MKIIGNNAELDSNNRKCWDTASFSVLFVCAFTLMFTAFTVTHSVWCIFEPFASHIIFSCCQSNPQISSNVLLCYASLFEALLQHAGLRDVIETYLNDVKCHSPLSCRSSHMLQPGHTSFSPGESLSSSCPAWERHRLSYESHSVRQQRFTRPCLTSFPSLSLLIFNTFVRPCSSV